MTPFPPSQKTTGGRHQGADPGGPGPGPARKLLEWPHQPHPRPLLTPFLFSYSTLALLGVFFPGAVMTDLLFFNWALKNTFRSSPFFFGRGGRGSRILTEALGLSGLGCEREGNGW